MSCLKSHVLGYILVFLYPEYLLCYNWIAFLACFALYQSLLWISPTCYVIEFPFLREFVIKLLHRFFKLKLVYALTFYHKFVCINLWTQDAASKCFSPSLWSLLVSNECVIEIIDCSVPNIDDTPTYKRCLIMDLYKFFISPNLQVYKQNGSTYPPMSFLCLETSFCISLTFLSTSSNLSSSSAILSW